LSILNDNKSIRPMQLSDLTEVMINERGAYPIPWSEGVMRDCIAGRNLCFVMQLNDMVVGHAIVMLVADETHLLNICISPAHARKGLCRFFLQYLIADARERKSALFFLEVRISNEVATQLYLTEGFNEVGVRPNYYPAEKGREDALLMTLDLSVEF
jgi:ribosomal-protein-alanine N-acetyltransferase